MFEKGDSSNREKINGCSFQQVLHQKYELIFVLMEENTFS